LPPIAEQEYYRRIAGDIPEEPVAKLTGRVTWHLKT